MQNIKPQDTVKMIAKLNGTLAPRLAAFIEMVIPITANNIQGKTGYVPVRRRFDTIVETDLQRLYRTKCPSPECLGN